MLEGLKGQTYTRIGSSLVRQLQVGLELRRIKLVRIEGLDGLNYPRIKRHGLGSPGIEGIELKSLYY